MLIGSKLMMLGACTAPIQTDPISRFAGPYSITRPSTLPLDRPAQLSMPENKRPAPLRQ
jgi:hypothetical protein